MGRELKRVALDFNWPLNEVWEGYLNPHFKPCPDCRNGQTGARDFFDAVVRCLMHQQLPGGPWLTDTDKEQLSEVTEGLAGRKRWSLGHDCSDVYSAECKILEAAGLEKHWGICPTCGGEDIHPNEREAYEAWEPTDPPAGEGWQLWETVTEGSPVSPVFPTREAFVEYLVEEGHKRETAERFCDEGWVLSMMIGPGGLKSNIHTLD